VTALIISCQIILGTFFLSILGIRRTRHPAMGALETDEEGREAAPGRVSRTRPGAVGTVGVDAGAPATAMAAQPPARDGSPADSSSANGGAAREAEEAGAGGPGAAGVPTASGRDTHAASADGT
jgi:hypothetical protein